MAENGNVKCSRTVRREYDRSFGNCKAEFWICECTVTLLSYWYDEASRVACYHELTLFLCLPIYV